MVSRRAFTVSALAMMGGLVTLPSCSSDTGAESYEQVAQRTWRHGEFDGRDHAALLRELVRYATLAPSSHNTQCWKFRIEDRSISVLPDLARRCPTVDPDDHHLFVSLGCAAENLIQAALAHGLRGQAVFDAAGNDTLRIALEPTPAVASPLFQAIPERQSTRAEYDGKPLSRQELEMLEKAGTGEGVRVILLTEREAMEQVLEYVVQGNTSQMNDPAFVEELKAWIRFSGGEAVRTGDGLYAASSGNPSLPSWLGRMLFGLFFTVKGENDKMLHGVRELLAIRPRAGLRVFLLAVGIGMPFPPGVAGGGGLGDGGLRRGEGLGHRLLDRGRLGRRGTRAGSGSGQRGVGASEVADTADVAHGGPSFKRAESGA